ncbi:MAG: hypothetical protein JWQ20_946 [Conexibacter sp.]|jgi:hypothetical protein|nr:hypothetical protein [Conexibacter sp.]
MAATVADIMELDAPSIRAAKVGDLMMLTALNATEA